MKNRNTLQMDRWAAWLRLNFRRRDLGPSEALICPCEFCSVGRYLIQTGKAIARNAQ